LRHGRRRGILQGLAMIPRHIKTHHIYRAPVSRDCLTSYLRLRRHSVPASF
jgi:hypothetical protein